MLVISFIVFTLLNPRLRAAGHFAGLPAGRRRRALAVGQTLIILTAGIDLSVGAITILAMMVMANLAAKNGVPAPSPS